jgi:hypothetical protein
LARAAGREARLGHGADGAYVALRKRLRAGILRCDWTVALNW